MRLRQRSPGFPVDPTNRKSGNRFYHSVTGSMKWAVFEEDGSEFMSVTSAVVFVICLYVEGGLAW